jgi:trehalose 6-phosphate phosphatase
VKNLLVPGNLDLLRAFAWSRVLVGLDFDGTLAPIVADPARAQMRERTRELLTQVCAVYPVVIISGRSRPDVQGRVRGTGVLEVIGNHGLEPGPNQSRRIELVHRWVASLQRRFAQERGVVIEDKLHSVAVHYRASREKKRARAEIFEAALSLGAVRIIGGKQVVNILPAGAPHKGMALERERDRLRCDTAIYLGDDETDEDVFALDQPGRLFSIRVGKKNGSAAGHYLASQRAVDELLRALLEFRRDFRQLRRAAR